MTEEAFRFWESAGIMDYCYKQTCVDSDCHIGQKISRYMECVRNRQIPAVEIDYNEIQFLIEQIQSKTNIELGRRFRLKRRKEYWDDARKTFTRLVKPQGGFCEVDHNILGEHFAKNWENEANYDIDNESSFIIQPKEGNCTLTEESAARSHLCSATAIANIIRYKGLISAPGSNKLTYGLLKADRDGASEVLSKIMNSMLLTEHCPESWKKAKTIMLPKPCPESEKDKPENWRPIYPNLHSLPYYNEPSCSLSTITRML
jgi:hypothetical protein